MKQRYYVEQVDLSGDRHVGRPLVSISQAQESARVFTKNNPGATARILTPISEYTSDVIVNIDLEYDAEPEKDDDIPF